MAGASQDAEAAAAPPLSRTNYVVQRLKQELVEGVLRPGQALRQVQIAERYGVSVTPVREALRILEADGTITYSPHRGATVRDIPPEMAADLYRLRASVEGLATQIAVERMAHEQFEETLTAHDELHEAKARGATGGELSALNKALHFAIYQSGSPLLLDHITTLWSRFPTNVTIWNRDRTATALAEDHAEIIAAIRAGRAEEAGALMSTHIQHAARLRSSNE